MRRSRIRSIYRADYVILNTSEVKGIGFVLRADKHSDDVPPFDVAADIPSWGDNSLKQSSREFGLGHIVRLVFQHHIDSITLGCGQPTFTLTLGQVRRVAAGDSRLRRRRGTPE
jgi:hypothetical protein